MTRRRKLTLDDGYEIFRKEGLEVGIIGLIAKDPAPTVKPEDLFESDAKDYTRYPPVRKASLPTLVKVRLRARHSIGGGGEWTVDAEGNKTLVNNGVRTYGPGEVQVTPVIAEHLVHQDMLAVLADQRTFDTRVRSHIIAFRRGPSGSEVAIGFDVTDQLDPMLQGGDLVHFMMNSDVSHQQQRGPFRIG